MQEWVNNGIIVRGRDRCGGRGGVWAVGRRGNWIIIKPRADFENVQEKSKKKKRQIDKNVALFIFSKKAGVECFGVFGVFEYECECVQYSWTNKKENLLGFIIIIQNCKSALLFLEGNVYIYTVYTQ